MSEDEDSFRISITEELEKKLDSYKELDQIIGEPEFTSDYDRYLYKKAVKYFDSTGFSDIVVDTLGYLYENPCPLSDAKKIYETIFCSNGESSGLDTTIIKNEILAASYRIDELKDEIKKWFTALMKLLKNRKVHNPYGAYEPLVFNSYHLLDAFSIYARAEDYPDIDFNEEDTKDKSPKPYLVDAGASCMKETGIRWYTFETVLDQQRESLKYEHIKDGIPDELNIFFDWTTRPEAGLYLEKNVVRPPTADKGTQTPPIPVILLVEPMVPKVVSDEDSRTNKESRGSDSKRTSITNELDRKRSESESKSSKPETTQSFQTESYGSSSVQTDIVMRSMCEAAQKSPKRRKEKQTRKMFNIWKI